MRATWRDIASRTRGRIVSGDPSAFASGVSIDSRSVSAGQAFFAIRGEVHDGHAFVAAAVNAGASGVVVSDASRAQGLPAGAAVIEVEDTTRALQDLAIGWRRAGSARILGITGSVGKTSTKELARLLISGERRTHASPGNLNNHYGLPLALLQAPADAEVIVAELGISTPGEMDRLIEIAEPDIGLVTVIAPVHIGNFSSFAELADEKMKLPRGSRRALLNADDPEQVRRGGAIAARVSWFGEAEAARSGVRLASVTSRGLLGSTVTLEDGERKTVFELPLAGRHQARNLLAAAALARAEGVSWDAMVRQARLAQPGPHRGRVLRAAGATIVDDTYNANPFAMRAALDLLTEATPATRRILVAGDMLELGDIAPAEHAALGRDAAPRVDVLVAVGPLAGQVRDGARAAGRDAVVLADADEAGRWLSSEVAAGDVVLVKGSRGIGLDRAVGALLAEHGLAGLGNGGGRS